MGLNLSFGRAQIQGTTDFTFREPYKVLGCVKQLAVKLNFYAGFFYFKLIWAYLRRKRDSHLSTPGLNFELNNE